jgi:hypothetical protein
MAKNFDKPVDLTQPQSISVHGVARGVQHKRSWLWIALTAVVVIASLVVSFFTSGWTSAGAGVICAILTILTGVKAYWQIHWEKSF